jgi:hypothetical protein
MQNKRMAVVSVLCIVAIFGAVVAKGEVCSVRATIPFDFLAGTQALSAGDYVVTKVSSVLSIRSAHSGAMVLANVSGHIKGGEESSLTFHRYGNRYFLASIWSSDSGMEFQVPKTQLEQELMAKGFSPTVELIAANLK